MKTAYAAGCLLTAEVAAGRRVAARWQDWGPVCFPAFPCMPAARAPAITSAFRAGRRRKELPGPLLSGKEQLSWVLLTDFISV